MASVALYIPNVASSQIIFNDIGSKNFVSKVDYASKGPHSIIEMTPALL